MSTTSRSCAGMAFRVVKPMIARKTSHLERELADGGSLSLTAQPPRDEAAPSDDNEQHQASDFRSRQHQHRSRLPRLRWDGMTTPLHRCDAQLRGDLRILACSSLVSLYRLCVPVRLAAERQA